MTSRTIDFRYKVLRNGADYGFLQAVSAPTIRCDNSAAIKMSFSGAFLPDARDASGNIIPVDFLSDEIEPILIIDGVEQKLGVFLPATVTPSEASGAEQVQIEAFDRCWRVRDVYSETLTNFSAGQYYLDSIDILLTQAGITTVLATPTAATLAEAREDWNIGTSYLTIINDLLAEINYNPLWFNQDGVAIIEPASVPTAENIEHTLDATNVESLILPTISRQTDIFQSPNVFVAYCANPDKSGIWTATAENTNPQSPLSVPRRGRRIMRVERLDNIASQDALQAYVDRKRNDSLISGETINIQTALLPGYGVADVVALHYGDINALCIDKAWSMKLSVGGTMTHTLERVVYNLE